VKKLALDGLDIIGGIRQQPRLEGSQFLGAQLRQFFRHQRGINHLDRAVNITPQVYFIAPRALTLRALKITLQV
jgi:hypothetical protein